MPGTHPPNDARAAIAETLKRIHSKHSRRYRRNSGTDQMCCMWSTFNPPDIIEGTKPFLDIEKAFGIEISDDEALQLYDMNLDEAAARILKIQESQRRTPGAVVRPSNPKSVSPSKSRPRRATRH